MTTALWIVIFFFAFWALIYFRASLLVTTFSFLSLLVLQTYFSSTSPYVLVFEWVVFLSLAVIFNYRPIRRDFFSKAILNFYRKKMPNLSSTEREALQAGTVTWEGELFSGAPSWSKLINLPPAKLSAEERAFIEGPVEELCRMTDDWDITHNRADLPPQVWQFLKSQGFFGLIIPKRYGGKEFSAAAHSAILVKLYGRSITLASTVSVPNSLGPAELLLHYGTEQQKDYYLPRLAKGEEVPCFALTNPEAGSDASSIPDTGVVCRGKYDGKDVIGIRLNWNKRYITLAPVATVLGLAFKLYDPEHLIGKQEERGITCALIPTNIPGIKIGRRHFPLNAPFQNGPTQGKDVFIPVDWIIGGAEMAGQGWRMLVECLAVGRAISLPSGALGSAKVLSWTTGAYARIRKQFHLPIGFFEGIQEVLAKIIGFAYIINAAQKFTVAAIDSGGKPSVPSAILKYHATELSRQISLGAMDIHAGKGICLGPRNYLGRGYETAPISITVEGANILTRNLIIFGQGAIRCHPYILAEMQAAQETDPKLSLKNFDKALFGHIGFTLSNVFRTLFLSLTSGLLVKAPHNSAKRYFQQLTRFSSAFALVADFAMLSLGGDLKRKESLSARLGDVLSMLYLGSATLKLYTEQEYKEDLPLIEWAMQTLLFNMQTQLSDFLHNFPNKAIAIFLQVLIFPYGKWFTAPRDRLTQQVAKLLLSPNETRDRLCEGIYKAVDPNNYVGLIDEALHKIILAEPIEKRLYQTMKNEKEFGLSFSEYVKMALATGILTQEEAENVLIAEAARKEIITVDDFTTEELARQKSTDETLRTVF